MGGSARRPPSGGPATENQLPDEATPPDGPNRANRTMQYPTIRDVSKLAGVSHMTVSRAIRNPDLVLPETRKRVQRAINELGYVPDRAAGSLVSRRTGFVALMLPTLTNTNFAAVAHGLTEALRPVDYDLLIAYTNYSLDEEQRQLRSLLSRRPEAIVLTGGARNSADSTLDLLLSAKIPVIDIADLPNDPIEHVVGFSNFEAGRTAARYLIARGFQRIGAVASSKHGDVTDLRGEERMRGFEEELRRAGRPTELVLRHGSAPVSFNHGATVTPLLVERGLDAVFAVSDLSAVGVVMECQRRGVRVPHDVSIMGFGDFEIGREINPSLTTIHVDFHALGDRTGHLIRELLAGGSNQSPRVIDVGLKIIERSSVAGGK